MAIKCKNFMCANYTRETYDGCEEISMFVKECSKRKMYDRLDKAWKKEQQPYFLNVFASERERANAK